MKTFEPIIKEIDGNTWNIEVHEDDNLPDPDSDVIAMYFKFASSNKECFTYKIRFPDTLLVSDNYANSEKRFAIGLDKAMNLFKNEIYNDYLSTAYSDRWEDEVAKIQLIKHSSCKH